MKEQLLEAIESFGENIDEKLNTPASIHLFIFNKRAHRIDEEKDFFSHSVVANLLYIMKRGRPDLETAMSFLRRRLSNSDVDGQEKPKRVLSWLKVNIDDKRIIVAENPTDIYMWIYAAYVVHGNMRSHTGGAISMGNGVLHEKASVQRLNTKSFTESDMFSVSEYLPYNLRNFFTWAQIWNNKQYSVSRQPKCNNDGEQWKELLYWEIDTYKYQIFFQ